MHWFDAANPYAPLNWFNAIGAAGCVLWMVAYAALIVRAHRDKAYGMPMLALCLNITWESVAFLYAPRPVALWAVIEGLWLVIDAVILWQFLRYGRDTALPPALRRYFYPMTVITLAACFIGHYTWLKFWDDKLLFVNAFIINLVMSVLFVQLWWKRHPQQRGLSLTAAWCKLAGTALTSIQCGIFLPRVMGDQAFRESWAFTWFLYVAIFIVDCVYVYLLYHGRRSISADRETP